MNILIKLKRILWKTLYTEDLKIDVIDALNGFLEPIRKTFENPEMQKLINKAYPNK